jgi:hypothetical protein
VSGFAGAAIFASAALSLRAATVGVIPVGPETIAAADALTAALSTLTNVVVVERAQLQKVIQEQALALNQPQSLVKAGRLLGADGLIWIEKRTPQPSREILSLRMAAITPGVVILENQFSLPLSSLSDWASNYARRIEYVLPKLDVRLEEAVPVSIGSLRASVAAGDAGSLEAELTALLRLRLAQEPSVFVLERRGLMELQTEKDLTAAEEPFWNGAVVVDGIINRDVVSQTSVTIHVRIAAARQPATELVVSGSRTALQVLIDELVAKILASLGKKGTMPVWQAKAEAENFLQEAQWAASWGLWPQAANHADTAWALGKRTPLVGAYRVTGRAWHCLGLRGPASYEYVGPYGFRSPPHPEIFPTLVRAMEIYRELFPLFTHPTNVTRMGWASLGLDLLLVNARVLDRFQERPELCESRETELREVRALGRDLQNLLLTNSGLGLAGLRRDLQGLPTVTGHLKDGRVSTIGEACLDARGVWFEDPLDTVGFYRKIFIASDYPRQRDWLFSEIPLTAWSARDRLRLGKIWCEFGRELTATTNAQARLDGWRILLTVSEDPRDLESGAEKMVEEALRGRVEIFNGTLDAPVAMVLSNTLRRIRRWGVVGTEEKLLSAHVAAQTRLTDDDPEFSYTIWKNLIASLSATNSRTLFFRRPHRAPPPAKIAELMAELQTLEREKRSQWRVGSYIEGLRAYGPAPVAVKAEPVQATPPPERTSDTATLRFSRVWQLDDVEFPPERTASRARYNTPFRKASWQEGSLWLEVQTYGTSHQGASPKLASLRLNPATMQSEIFVDPFESFVAPYDYRGHIVVLSNQLFVTGPGAVWRHNVDGTWKKFSVPADLGSLPYRWSNHIALSALGVILDFDPEKGDARVLASTRRNPPASALDGRALGLAPLAVWPDNTLCAVVEGEVWRFDPGAKDWRVFASATNCGQSVEVQPQGVFFRQASKSSFVSGGVRQFLNCGPQLLGGWRPHRIILDYYTWTPVALPSSRGPSEMFTPPAWQHPAGSFPHDCQAQFDGANIWVFPAPFRLGHFEIDPPSMDQYGRPLRAGTNYIPSTILFLDGARNETIELEVQFTGPARDVAGAYEEHHAQGRNHVEFIHTKQGLAIVVIPEGVVFWAPRQDVEAALAAARSRALPGYIAPLPGSSRFDKDGKGWLDDSERRAWRQDASMLKEQTRHSEAAISAALRQHGVEWDKLFAQIDQNRDGKVSGPEMDLAAKAHPETFHRRFAGLNGSPAQLVRSFNKDNDLGLDPGEFRAFMAEPRLLSDLNRSGDWLARFGLKAAQWDINDNGILDAHERVQALRLLREQSPPK